LTYERVIERERVLSLLIHANSKEGKSTLTSTAPTPHLVLDAEGGWKFIDEMGFKTGRKLRKRLWDPLQEPIPRFDDTWDVVRVHVDSWLTLKQVDAYLRQAEHDFVSLTADSITEAQRRCKANIKGTGPMQIQQWGQLLDDMDALIRGFRDLVLLPNTLRVITFIAETKMWDGQWRPHMQGQIRDTLPYWVDICGYMFTELRAGDGEVQTKIKRLLIGAGVNPAYIAGERTQGRLPDIIDNPDISAMLAAVYPTSQELARG
jgi:hypothetical protein